MSDAHLSAAREPALPLVVRAETAEVLGIRPDTITLLADAAATGGLLGASRTTMGHGRDGAVPHYHRGSAEMFFVLDGRMQVLVGTEVVEAGPGDTLVVPPETTHAFAAAPGSAADVLIVITPGVDRFAYFRLLDRVRTGRADPADLLAVQERFDTLFVDSATWRQVRAA